MQNKQTLRVEHADNNEIVSNQSSHTSFIDTAFYTNVMKENTEKYNYKSFPVKIIALRV